MADSEKFFELLVSQREDQETKAELINFLKDSPDNAALCSAGYQPRQAVSSSTSFGYHAQPAQTLAKGSSLFMIALEKNKPFTAEYLLEELGVRLLLQSNEKHENGFHAVAKFNNIDFKSWFLRKSCAANTAMITDEYKLAVNQITEQGEQVLTLIPPKDLSIDEVNAWTNIGADVHLKGRKYGNFLHHCCEHNHLALVRALATYYPSLMHQRNNKGRYPVHIAAGLNASDCLRALIEAGTPVTVEDQAFNRPLHMAVAKGSIEAMRLILQSQDHVPLATKSLPYVNIQNASHETLLHLLVMYNAKYTEHTFTEALDVLLAYGADPTLTNSQNYTAMRLAREMLDNKKLSHGFFSIFWEGLVTRVNVQVFTQSTLFSRIHACMPPQHAQQLTTALSPIFQSNQSTAHPYHIIQEQYIEALKRTARIRYADNPQMVQSFALMLDELVKCHAQQQEQRGALHTTQWDTASAPSQSPPTRSDSPMSRNAFL